MTSLATLATPMHEGTTISSLHNTRPMNLALVQCECDVGK